MRTWYSKSLAALFALLVLVVCGNARAQQPRDILEGPISQVEFRVS